MSFMSEFPDNYFAVAKPTSEPSIFLSLIKRCDWTVGRRVIILEALDGEDWAFGHDFPQISVAV